MKRLKNGLGLVVAISLVGLAALSGFAPEAHAGGCTVGCNPLRYDSNGGEVGVGPTADEPNQGASTVPTDDVLLHNGGLITRVVDLKIPGRGMDFEFVRTYKSRITYEGILGHNWDFTYNSLIAAGGLNGQDLVVLNGAGHQDTFQQATTTTYTPTRGLFVKLLHNPTLIGNGPTLSNSTVILKKPGGSLDVFEAYQRLTFSGGGPFISHTVSQPRWRLNRSQDRHGNALSFVYDDRGLLVRVIDTLGRPIDFVYGFPDGSTSSDLTHIRLLAIQDFAGRRVTYQYDSQGDLVAVTSPVVVGTPNGNDFPNGKTTRYTYSSGFSNPRLNHNLLTITQPNEVAEPSNGPPVLTNVYDANDQVIVQDYGGINTASGARGLGRAGGKYHYFYQDLTPQGDIQNLTLRRTETTVVDPNGNVEVKVHNINGNLLETREYTGRTDPENPNSPTFPLPIPKLRVSDPDVFTTQYVYSLDGLLQHVIYPEGNSVAYTYDTANPDRRNQPNLLEVRRIVGPRGGDGTGSPSNDIVTRYVYEPIFNQVRMVSDPRGLDPSFVPPVDPADTNVVGIDFNGNGTVTATERRRARYTTVHVFDYQEGTTAQILALAQAHNVPLTEADARRLSLGDTVARDANGDGLTTQQQGNEVRTKAPTVQLLPGSQQAQREGDLTQEVATLFGYNSRGQRLFRIDPDGSRDEYKYYPESNPHGAGGITPDADTVNELGGYLGRMVRDTTAIDNFDHVALNLTTDSRYNPVGNVISVLDGRGVRTDFLVNDLNQVVRTTRAADISASHESGLIPFAYTVTNFYDANENLIRVDVQNKDGDTDSNATLTTDYAYDIFDDRIEMKQEVTPIKTLTTGYRYDANRNPIRVIEPVGNFHDIAYDERDLVFTATTGANDSALSSMAQVTYDQNRNRAILRDAEDNNGDGVPEETRFTYDGFDRLVKTLDPVGNESLVTYDPANNRLRATARGRIGGPSPTDNSTASNVDLSRSALQYDELSRRIRTNGEWFLSTGVMPARPPIPVADGLHSTVTEYDRNSRATRTVNDNTHEATFEYDGVDRLVRTLDALQNGSRLAYDPNDNLLTRIVIERRGDAPSVSPETFVTVNRYDALNRLRFTSDNLHQVHRMAYDSRNNETWMSDAEGPVNLNDPQLGLLNRSGNTVRYFYDGINRKTQVIKDLRLGAAGNGEPNLDGPADPNLDPPNLDTSNPANPDGRITETSVWDDNSRQLLVADDNNHATTYAYDALNRKTLATFADGTTNAYVYGRDSNLTQLTDENGSVFTRTYDAINRLIQTTINRAAGIGGTTLQTYEYDGLSRSTRATDNNDPSVSTDNSVVTSLYDSLSRKIEEVQDNRVVTSDFDGLGNRTRLIYPQPNNRTLTYIYDALERLKSIPGVVTAYSFIGPGRILERTYANTAKLTYLDNAGADVGYDGIKRIVRHRHETSTDGTIADFTYGFNRENMRTFERRLHQPAGPDAKGEAYRYDSLYRVKDFKVGTQDSAGQVTTVDTQTAYNLDGVGNRTFINKDAIVTNYAPNNMNEYDSVGGVTNLHDNNGNLKDEGTLLFTHDGFNRLIKVRSKSSGLPTIAVYTYDAANRRVVKTVTNSGALDGATHFLWDGWQEIEERNAADAVLAQYAYGSLIDEILTMDRGGATYYYHNDSLGSIEALTNSTQAIVERTTYDAYGAPQFTDANFNPFASTTSSVGNPFLFTAQRLDPETGLYYYRNRYYNSSTGRFIERDPMGYAAGSLGLYEYVGGDGINQTDAMGLREDDDWVTGIMRGFNRAMIWSGIQGVSDKIADKMGKDFRSNEPPPCWMLCYSPFVQAVQEARAGNQWTAWGYSALAGLDVVSLGSVLRNVEKGGLQMYSKTYDKGQTFLKDAIYRRVKQLNLTPIERGRLYDRLDKLFPGWLLRARNKNIIEGFKLLWNEGLTPRAEVSLPVITRVFKKYCIWVCTPGQSYEFGEAPKPGSGAAAPEPTYEEIMGKERLERMRQWQNTHGSYPPCPEE